MMNYVLSKYLTVSDPISQGRYRILFSARSGDKILMNSEKVEALMDGDLGLLDEHEVESLKKHEVLVSAAEDELSEVLAYMEKGIKNTSVLYYSIQPSSDCQLGCPYCGQEHTKGTLTQQDYSLIIRRIESRLAHNPQYKHLFIGWFGAEPLMGLRAVKELTQELRDLATRYGCTYGAKMVSNGLSLKPTIYQELIKLGVQEVNVTLDGTKEYHDERRFIKKGGSSFDLIFSNLEKIINSSTYDPNQCEISLRCNVDKKNHAGLFDLIDLLADKGIAPKIRKFKIAPIHSWGNDAHLSSLEHEQFAAFEMEALIYMAERGFQRGYVPNSRVTSVCLSLTKDGEIIDANGKVYNCTEVSYVPDYENSPDYLIADLRQNEQHDLLQTRPLQDWNSHDIAQGKVPCATCSILPICGGACPKLWREGIIPCPSLKINLKDRLLLDFSTNMDQYFAQFHTSQGNSLEINTDEGKV